ncbi:MAG: alpha/beta hydrolase [Xanthomonadales bacterium]|nr:alpha/beta hydrolase [Xanthomonadales bacterium]
MLRHPFLRPALLLLASGLLAACQPALFTGVNLVAPKSTDQVADGQVFAPGQDLALDLYLPEAGASPPSLVVFFYGGSWQQGERHWYAFVGQALARHGLAVAIPDYRKAPFPAFMEDAAAAVAWLKAQGSSLGYDPDRIVLMGHSAGAHIAALLATDPQYLARHDLSPSDLRGVIGLAGPYDFLPIRSRPLREVFGDDPARQRASQPIAHVDGSEPPFLLLHGRDDRLVEPGNSTRLAKLLRAHGVPVELHLVPDVGHAGLMLRLARPASAGEETLAWLTRFTALATQAERSAHPLRSSPD